MKSTSAIRDVASRYWKSGALHRAHVLGLEFDRLDIPLNPPRGRRLASEFAEARTWSEEISRFAQRHRLAVEHCVVENRSVGRQTLPDRLVIAAPDALLSVANKRAEFEAFVALCDQVLERSPALRELFATQPHRVMTYRHQWNRLLQILERVATKDVSGLYLRELDLPGIDTKFISDHKGILDSVLRAALPPCKLRDSQSRLAGHGFERRYGFRYEQPLVRYRMLDAALAGCYDDISVPLDQFAATPIAVATVFVVENKMNLLAFPAIANAIAIWGQGYAVTRLSTVAWLTRRRVVYFGDIDTHGFTILDRLRKAFPNTRSMLMDRETLLAHRHAWVSEPDAKRQLNELPRLNDEERDLFNELRRDRLGQAVRLEQERIGYRWIKAAASRMAGP